MPNGPLDKLLQDHFSSKEGGTARVEQERARQSASVAAAGSQQIDQLWEDHTRDRSGYVFTKPPMQKEQRGTGRESRHDLGSI